MTSNVPPFICFGSPSLRGRGLKLRQILSGRYVRHVALFTRAWIEILWLLDFLNKLFVALFTRAWIEILSLLYCAFVKTVALFTRAWIEIPTHLSRVGSCVRRPLYEGVDWNTKTRYNIDNERQVALFTRAWIEIFAPLDIPAHFIVALFTRAWIEIQSLCTHNTRRCVALFTRAWIEILTPW